VSYNAFWQGTQPQPPFPLTPQNRQIPCLAKDIVVAWLREMGKPLATTLQIEWNVIACRDPGHHVVMKSCSYCGFGTKIAVFGGCWSTSAPESEMNGRNDFLFHYSRFYVARDICWPLATSSLRRTACCRRFRRAPPVKCHREDELFQGGEACCHKVLEKLTVTMVGAKASTLGSTTQHVRKAVRQRVRCATA